jgi:hypothetical protein
MRIAGRGQSWPDECNEALSCALEDNKLLRAERVFFVFYGATWLRQDCARPAIASDFFKNHSRRVYLIAMASETKGLKR